MAQNGYHVRTQIYPLEAAMIHYASHDERKCSEFKILKTGYGKPASGFTILCPGFYDKKFTKLKFFRAVILTVNLYYFG